jgi:membrane-associated protease RseP (regulator of RpoE activity)
MTRVKDFVMQTARTHYKHKLSVNCCIGMRPCIVGSPVIASLVFSVIIGTRPIHSWNNAHQRRHSSVNPPMVRTVHWSQNIRSKQCNFLCAQRNRALQLPALPEAASVVVPSLLGTFGSSIGSVFILAIIVLIHESGHYLAAKRFGIAVEEFSIGFGPKIFGTANPEQEEFNLRWIPLGGYVRFPENYNMTLARELQLVDLLASEDFIRQRQPGLMEQIVNALSLGFVEDFLWQKEKQRRQKELQNQLRLEQSLPWWKRFGVKKANTGKDVGTEIEYYDDPSLLQNRPWVERAIVLSGGVIFNLLLAFCIYFGQINIGPGLPVPTFDNGIVVASPPRRDAAANGLLRQGDIILRVNGIDVMPSHSAPSVYASQKAITEFISQIRSTPEGESMTLTIVHPNEKKPVDVSVQPKRSSVNGPVTIGTLLAPNYKQTDLVQTKNPLQAAMFAFQYVLTTTQETAHGVLALIAMFLSGLMGGGSTGASAGVAQVAGPLGLIRTGSDVVASQDGTAIFLFMAAISVNLAVINSLPLPALDGGQLLFVLSEAVTGRKVNQRVQEQLTAVAVLFLLLVSASTFVGDLNAVFTGR